MRKDKFGYLLEISYKGKKFDCFDEMKDKKSVKGTLKKYLKELNINIIKGLQQAGRTDARVSANQNYIYFISNNFNMDIIKINEDIEGLKIISIKKVKPNLILPDLVKRRLYIYHYPKKFLNISEDEIKIRCKEISGIKDFSDFTNHKGLKLKNHIRDVKVSYIDEKLYFDGNSFLPMQVRIMASYILKGKKEPMDAKFLRLEKVIFESEEL